MAGAEPAAVIERLLVLDEEVIADRDCLRVWVLPRLGRPVTYWICTDTGALLRRTRELETTDYRDHRDVDGLLVPFRRTTTWAAPVADRRIVTLRSAERLPKAPPATFTPE